MIDCASVQAALSARLDGEATGLPDDIIDAHLSGCEDCQAYLDSAASLNRQLTFTGMDSPHLVAPDLSAQIFAELEPSAKQQHVVRTSTDLSGRSLLVVLGIVFIVWAVIPIAHYASTPTPDEVYSAEIVDVAAFRLAFGFALFFAAWKPRLVAGMLPIFAAVTMFLLGFGIRDVLLLEATTQKVAAWLLHIAATGALAWVWLHSLGWSVVGKNVRSLGASPLKND